MEQPASLFLVLYAILCLRLLLVSHEALPAMQQWLYQCFIIFILYLFLNKKIHVHAYHSTHGQKAL